MPARRMVRLDWQQLLRSAGRLPRVASEAAWRMPIAGAWRAEREGLPSMERRLLVHPWLPAVYVLMVVLVGLCRFVLHIEAFVLGAFLICFGLPFLAYVTVQAIDKSAQAFDHAHRMVEDPRDREVCPVLLTVFRDGLVTGEDAGVAWFEGETLIYSGELCSFIIGTRDLSPEDPWRIASRFDQLSDLDQLLFLRSDGPALSIRLEPAFAADSFCTAPARALEFMERKRQFKPGSGGPERSTYPPLEVLNRLEQDPAPFRHLLWVQILAFIYFVVLSMVAGVSASIGLPIAAVGALCVPIFRPRRNRRVVATAQK